MTLLFAYDLSSQYKLFTRQIKAKKDPVSGVVLVPAYATAEPVLDEKDGYARGFVDGQWHYFIDQRGMDYWDESSTKYTITEVNLTVPEGALLVEPEATDETTDEELATTARTKRDQMIGDISYRYERFASESRLFLETTDSIEALDKYAQALRDITKQEGFPTNIEWPPMP